MFYFLTSGQVFDPDQLKVPLLLVATFKIYSTNDGGLWTLLWLAIVSPAFISTANWSLPLSKSHLDRDVIQIIRALNRIFLLSTAYASLDSQWRLSEHLYFILAPFCWLVDPEWNEKYIIEWLGYILYVALHLSTLSVALFPHQLGKATAFPLAPKTANERMKRMTWLPPSRAADNR